MAFFPKRLKERKAEIKVSTSEKIPEWFHRCAKEVLAGDIASCQIEENTALFAVVGWKNAKFNYINVQSLICNGCSLEEFSRGGNSADWHSHRLDLDLSITGEIFKEALPHVHTRPNGPPRFFLDIDKKHNVIVDFIEFLYLNYHYDKWLGWAESAWRRSKEGKTRADTFSVITKAYKENQIVPTIERYEEHIIALKNILRQEKENKSFELNIDKRLLRTLNYPL